MSFLNALPLPVLVLLGFAILGFYDYLKKLYTWGTKIELFSNYREKLAIFHNNTINNEVINRELSDYLLENALKIKLDSIIQIRIDHPMWRVSTGMMTLINDIVTGDYYNFTETCRNFENMLTQNIGAFKNQLQETRSKIINPIRLIKNGVFLIFDIIPIVNLFPKKIKGFLYNLFWGISIVETLLSLFTQMSIIRQIITWISQSIL